MIGLGISYFDLPAILLLRGAVNLPHESHRQEIRAFSRTIFFVAFDMFRVRWAPSSSIVSSCGMLNLDYLRTIRKPLVLVYLRRRDHTRKIRTGDLPTQDLLRSAYNRAKIQSADCLNRNQACRSILLPEPSSYPRL